MEELIFINKRAIIYGLIKKVSDFSDGDDIEWLRDYAKWVIETNKNDLDSALSALREWESQVDYLKANNLRYP